MAVLPHLSQTAPFIMNAIEREILRLVGENVESPDVFTDITPVRDSVNDAIEEISMVTGGVRQSYKLVLKKDQMFYRLSFADGYFGWITHAWYAGQRRTIEHRSLGWLDKQNSRWMKEVGTPLNYFIAGEDVLGIHPVPAGDGGVIDLDCTVIPLAYTADGDQIRVRNEFHRALVHFAVSEYWASRGDAKEAMKHHQQYLKVLGLASIYPMDNVQAGLATMKRN